MSLLQKPTVITLGEPAGIGVDCVLQIASQHPELSYVVIGNEQLLRDRARLLNLEITLYYYHPFQPWPPNKPGLYLYPVDLGVQVETGLLNLAHVPYVLKCLELAVDGCLQGEFHALVTGPVHKGIINQAGIQFSGHTEWLADYIRLKVEDTKQAIIHPVMLLTANSLRVALATTHLPLSQVASAITTRRLSDTLQVLHHDLKTKFNIPQPKILVCGLNPHAGEQGHLGREELETIIPTLELLRSQGLQLIGPVPADTAFITSYQKQVDVVLAMYHDQGLPVIKSQAFEEAVNVTLGLPIIRTSVDHGTALSLAGTGKASYHSLLAAINLANRLVAGEGDGVSP